AAPAAAAPTTAPAAAAPTAAPAAAAPTTAPAAAAPTAAPAVVAPSAGQVTISWFNPYTTKTTQEALPLVIGEFEKQNPDIKVDYQNPGGTGGGGSYTEALLSKIAGGNPPDVATLFSTPAEFAASGSLVPIDDYMSAAKTAKPDAFYPAPLKSCQWQSKTYALPSSAGAGAVFYNVDMFKAKNLPIARDQFPKTWDELKALSKEFLVQENGEIKQAGIVPFVGNTWLYPAWSAMNGGKIYDAASNKYMIDSEQNVQWLDSWVKWLDEQFGGDYEKLNQAAHWEDVYPDSAFNQKKAAMEPSGSWAVTDAEIPFAWEVAKLPYGPSGSKSMTSFWPNWWAIPKGAQHPEAAFRFLEFISTTGWEIWYGFIMDTPSWKQFPKTVSTTKLVNAVGKDRAAEVDAFFADYLNDAVEMWTSPVESFANDTLGAAVGEVLSKKKSAKDALAEVQKLCQDKLNETLKG
ncbi:MAG TPA: sugar ABC transporter substrate-binding protein, partial [Roseiflexaceae bacterium]|nr:sugar ABC transporter substrate-binding protein [Roseiflexaceae bacterium]